MLGALDGTLGTAIGNGPFTFCDLPVTLLSVLREVPLMFFCPSPLVPLFDKDLYFVTLFHNFSTGHPPPSCVDVPGSSLHG